MSSTFDEHDPDGATCFFFQSEYIVPLALSSVFSNDERGREKPVSREKTDSQRKTRFCFQVIFISHTLVEKVLRRMRVLGLCDELGALEAVRSPLLCVFVLAAHT